jgi:hypothetical protein
MMRQHIDKACLWLYVVRKKHYLCGKESITMIQEYKINGISETWLHQPGMMVYVETEYNEAVNCFINYNHDEICRWCSEHGLVFIYAPNFIYRCGAELIEYMVGEQVWSKFLDSTTIVLKKTLSDSSFSQIKGTSLLFTEDSCDSVSSYLIDEKDIKTSFEKILAYYHQRSVSTIEKELFVECPVRLLELEKKTDLRNGIRLSIRRDKETDKRIKNEIKVIFNKFLSNSSQMLAEDEEEEEKHSCRFRVVDWDEFVEKPSSHKEEIDDGLNKEDDIDMHLFQEAQNAIVKLLERGYSKETIWALLIPMQELSPIHVTQDYRIELSLYGKEIELPPVQKAIYLLFLKHPEGIYFKNLPDYEEELYHLYRKLAIRGTKDKHIQTVKDLVNPLGNSMNEKCSLIKKRILAIYDDSLAKHYYISGEKGELKRIDMKPEMITWE